MKWSNSRQGQTQKYSVAEVFTLSYIYILTLGVSTSSLHKLSSFDYNSGLD